MIVQTFEGSDSVQGANFAPESAAVIRPPAGAAVPLAPSSSSIFTAVAPVAWSNSQYCAVFVLETASCVVFAAL